MDPSERQRILEWDAIIDEVGYEQVLGVSENASEDDCRQAYYKFAQCFHPDMHPQVDAVVHRALCRLFQRGSEAYRVLAHGSLRTQWRNAKRRGEVRLSDLAPPPNVDLGAELPRLHERCRSAGAKLHATSAAKAHARGDVAATTRHLEQALIYDGGANLDLVRCLDAVAELSAGD